MQQARLPVNEELPVLRRVFDIHGQNVNLKVLADGKNVSTHGDSDSKVKCFIPSTRALVTVTAGNPNTSERREIYLRVTQGDPE